MKFQDDKEKQCFEKLSQNIGEIIETKCDGYDELFGHKISTKQGTAEEVTMYYHKEVAEALLFKVCKAYQFEYDTVVDKLVKILKWRQKFNPLSCAFRETHNKELEQVGILTQYPEDEANKRVVTWNLYGKLVKKKELFKDVQKFLRYRIGLMEKGMQLLDFQDEDNSYMTQVHDYKTVSVWRMDSDMKSCVKEVINIFQTYYPELLYAKYFVNVPSVFGWAYDVIKTFVDSNTRKKFVVLNDGKKLGKYLTHCPREQYGGVSPLTILQQNITAVKATPYAAYLLEKQEIEDIE
ncbi:Phosphatidylinositol transfer protein SFH5 [Nakaseomyces bracarensis]|uniref:Phosphatidylinositol transfer protein SFH5 n=1 Tax=Nakaseomyces bracarensis TaxID=273131 RepID=A0ABR4NQN8_9SACH